jgi:hypothetical protein
MEEVRHVCIQAKYVTYLLPRLHILLGSWCLFRIQRSSSCLMSNAKVAHLLWLLPWSSNFIKILCMFDTICCNRCIPHKSLIFFQNNYSLFAALEWNCFILKMSTLNNIIQASFCNLNRAWNLVFTKCHIVRVILEGHSD